MTLSHHLVRLVLCALAGILLASAASAQVSAYLCDMTNRGWGYSGDDRYFLQLDEGKGEVFAYDALIDYTQKNRLVVAKYAKGTNGRFEFQYSVDIKDRRNNTFRGDFRVTFFPGRRDLLLSAIYAGYDNAGMGGMGKCKPTKPIDVK